MEPVQSLSELTSSAAWPGRWLTVAEFVERLDRLGWWQQQGLVGGTPQRKEAFLRAALQTGAGEGALLWARVGALYKHVARLSAEDYRALAEFNSFAERDSGSPAAAGACRGTVGETRP
jgi:hypothetical protein